MKEKDVTKKDFLSITEAAKVIGVTRQHVHRLVKSGEIPAERYGHTYMIKREDLPGPFADMTSKEKVLIDKAVDKVFKEYGEVIRKLGKE